MFFVVGRYCPLFSLLYIPCFLTNPIVVEVVVNVVVVVVVVILTMVNDDDVGYCHGHGMVIVMRLVMVMQLFCFQQVQTPCKKCSQETCPLLHVFGQPLINDLLID